MVPFHLESFSRRYRCPLSKFYPSQRTYWSYRSNVQSTHQNRHVQFQLHIITLIVYSIFCFIYEWKINTIQAGWDIIYSGIHRGYTKLPRLDAVAINYMHTHVMLQTYICIIICFVSTSFGKSMHDFYFLNLSLLPTLSSSFVKCNSLNIFPSVPCNCDRYYFGQFVRMGLLSCHVIMQ